MSECNLNVTLCGPDMAQTCFLWLTQTLSRLPTSRSNEWRSIHLGSDDHHGIHMQNFGSEIPRTTSAMGIGGEESDLWIKKETKKIAGESVLIDWSATIGLNLLDNVLWLPICD